MEVQENNKLIAEFMGFRRTNDNDDELDGSSTERYKHWHLGGLGYFDDNDLKYHSSWEWLMPVIEKIEALPEDKFHGRFAVSICSNGCSIYGTNLDTRGGRHFHPAYMSDPNAILETKIESTWYNVVSFIKWFNTQKQ